ncbi:hypothetical protein FDP41_013168 [Naegleria fowleri]|uniref:Uncharacterized protein n=1 Tax=Naegleria fowleri TaxID=5763 RepID=A0A6A5C5B1_NAEFO|nr:uncharacterized protein FDP41_013168 [Naegleria fowleri]KAF0980685.1 hypothetical protein FDP41_013168 [Naegleria fowleri]CAG4715460.1 unnamed protein product [Naegleria fowleri]
MSQKQTTSATTTPKPPNARTLSHSQNFYFGGLSGMMATCVVQPIDLIKTRMQLARARPSVIGTLSTIIKEEGAKRLYKGLDAALFRQITYTTTRLGVFNTLQDYLTKTDATTGKKTQPNFAMKILTGMFAGGVGALVGNPAEVCLIRLTSGKYNYRHVGEALVRIIKEEGIARLWRGTTPTVTRAVILNAAQLSCYSQAKEMILKYNIMKDGLGCHIASSLISGFMCTVVSIPVDLAKTRLQSMKVDPVTLKPEYSGSLDVITRVAKNEGVLSLWKGFTPYFLRLGPHTVLTFVFLEQFRMAFGY